MLIAAAWWAVRIRVVGAEFLVWVAARVACCGSGRVGACTWAMAGRWASWSTAALGVGGGGGLVPLGLFRVDIYEEPIENLAEGIMK